MAVWQASGTACVASNAGTWPATRSGASAMHPSLLTPGLVDRHQRCAPAAAVLRAARQAAAAAACVDSNQPCCRSILHIALHPPPARWRICQRAQLAAGAVLTQRAQRVAAPRPAAAAARLLSLAGGGTIAASTTTAAGGHPRCRGRVGRGWCRRVLPMCARAWSPKGPCPTTAGALVTGAEPGDQQTDGHHDNCRGREAGGSDGQPFRACAAKEEARSPLQPGPPDNACSSHLAPCSPSSCSRTR